MKTSFHKYWIISAVINLNFTLFVYFIISGLPWSPHRSPPDDSCFRTLIFFAECWIGIIQCIKTAVFSPCEGE